MKKHVLTSLSLIVILTQFSACYEEAEITKLGIIEFPQTFSSSVSTIELTAENDSARVVDFSWQAVSYGIDAPVTYSLQFTVPSDTIGANAWANAQEIVVGNDILTKGLMGYDMNRITLNGLGMEPGVDAKLSVRVKSFVNRPAYSNTITLDIKPFKPTVVIPDFPSLWVPGDYQGWDPATAPTIASVNDDGLYEGYVYFPEGGTLQYKYTAQPAWEPMAYGDGGAGQLIEANYSGANFTVPSAGYYELSANLNTMRWTATRTNWGVIGDATPGGWSTDTPMNYDVVNQVWTVTLDMTAAGSFKFRANNTWAINFGIDSDGKIRYADNPLYPYNPNLSNLTVPSDGNYTITLDLHVAGNYTFTLKKN